MGLGWYDDEGHRHDPEPYPGWVVFLIGVIVGAALCYLVVSGNGATLDG